MSACRYFVPSPGFLCTPSPTNDCTRFEDSYDALVNVSKSWMVALALCGNIVSIAFFKWVWCGSIIVVC